MNNTRSPTNVFVGNDFNLRGIAKGLSLFAPPTCHKNEHSTIYLRIWLRRVLDVLQRWVARRNRRRRRPNRAATATHATPALTPTIPATSRFSPDAEKAATGASAPDTATAGTKPRAIEGWPIFVRKHERRWALVFVLRRECRQSSNHIQGVVS